MDPDYIEGSRYATEQLDGELRSLAIFEKHFVRAYQSIQRALNENHMQVLFEGNIFSLKLIHTILKFIHLFIYSKVMPRFINMILHYSELW